MTIPLWKTLLRQSFTQWRELADFLELGEDLREKIDSDSPFHLQVSRRLASKMRKGTLDDPLVRQFLPLKEERKVHPLFIADPVGEASCHKQPKLLQKYEGRALLVCTSACAMHCRYCFRRHFPYETQYRGFERELEAIAADPSLREIILSGGDPLSLDDAILEQLLKSLERIPHVRRIRFHTRFPVGIPERIDDSFLSIIENCRRPPLFVFHINHPQEWDDALAKSVHQLRMRGCLLFCQSVLLQGINDSLEILEELCEKMIEHGIVPYYLHQMDRVAGGAHFAVSEEEGKNLVQGLRNRLSGYAVPAYVREESGAPSKIPL